jgi:probable HAF family extracellular repeat protein
MSTFRINGGRGVLLIAILGAAFVAAGADARADAMYTITGLGTLPGQSSSVAMGINNEGQVVGISYNSANGYFATTNGTDNNPPSAWPPTFITTGNGAQSFLYSNGQMSQINPIGGLATAINNSGQVVGGNNASINDSGQYVTGQVAGINTGNYNAPSQLVSGGVATNLPLMPDSINNSGEIAGTISVNTNHGGIGDPAIYQNGQVTDLASKVANGLYSYDSRAVAINQKGDVIINVLPFSGPQSGTTISYLYQSATGQAINLTALPGASNFFAVALNSKDQAVGGGYLYDDGTVKLLTSLIPPATGWSNLVATGINDAGQIVGEGFINGREQAFLMTPEAAAPEPAALAMWVVLALGGCAIVARRTTPRP